MTTQPSTRLAWRSDQPLTGVRMFLGLPGDRRRWDPLSCIPCRTHSSESREDGLLLAEEVEERCPDVFGVGARRESQFGPLVISHGQIQQCLRLPRESHRNSDAENARRSARIRIIALLDDLLCASDEVPRILLHEENQHVEDVANALGTSPYTVIQAEEEFDFVLGDP